MAFPGLQVPQPSVLQDFDVLGNEWGKRSSCDMILMIITPLQLKTFSLFSWISFFRISSCLSLWIYSITLYLIHVFQLYMLFSSQMSSKFTSHQPLLLKCQMNWHSIGKSLVSLSETEHGGAFSSQSYKRECFDCC